MKKLMITAILLIAGTSLLPAQTSRKNNPPAQTNKTCPQYTDVNKNNVCDNYENNTRQYGCKPQGNRPGACNGNVNRQGRQNRTCPMKNKGAK
jgi:hypothetical protein